MSDGDKGAVEDGTDAAALHASAQELKRAIEAEQSEPEPDEAEARALLDSFDGRIAEIERRIDRVLARLDAG